MTQAFTVPDPLEAIIQRYDAKELPFDEFAIGGELKEARGALVNPSESEHLGAWAEVLAFALATGQHENPWNNCRTLGFPGAVTPAPVPESPLCRSRVGDERTYREAQARS
jgi:hypothetical protein